MCIDCTSSQPSVSAQTNEHTQTHPLHIETKAKNTKYTIQIQIQNSPYEYKYRYKHKIHYQSGQTNEHTKTLTHIEAEAKNANRSYETM